MHQFDEVDPLVTKGNDVKVIFSSSSNGCNRPLRIIVQEHPQSFPPKLIGLLKKGIQDTRQKEIELLES